MKILYHTTLMPSRNVMMRSSALLFILSFFICTRAQLQCPSELGWHKNDDSCYKFESYPRYRQTSAEGSCEQNGATLLNIGSGEEHTFIKNWLQDNDPQRTDWLTSGVSTISGVSWTGDGTTSVTTYWADSSEPNITGRPIIYTFYQGTEYGWMRGDMDTEYAYICEIPLNDVYKIVEEIRDFDYGLDVDNPTDAPRGPMFIQEPLDTVVLGTVKSVSLECLAEGNPEPQYEWLMLKDKQWVPVQPSSRISFTTGKLEIDEPKLTDENRYQCKASNDIGISLSRSASLTFGDLGDFSNVPPSKVRGAEYEGTQLECPEIIGKPSITYQWYKDSVTSFIRPNLQVHSFLSMNGKLYFSELAPSDAGTYHCMANLFSYGSGGLTVSVASESRTSPGFDLEVTSGGGRQYQPQILNEFPYIFPKNPVRGGEMLLECFAYGTGPLIYTWSRADNKPLPEGHTFDSNGRILILTALEMADGGEYNCHVRSTTTQQEDSAVREVIIQAQPYFTYPLSHMHLDVGTQLIWHCEAGGMPLPTYSWYKDGEVIGSDEAAGRRITQNSLTIEAVEAKRDEGMYQCAATNTYATTFSTAQLRVLEIPPSFDKQPMVKTQSSARQGTVEIECNPVAAPAPTYRWYKDGRDLGLDITTNYLETDHYQLLRSGNLYIVSVQTSDQGRYTCSVENPYGTDDDYTDLLVLEGTQISTPPGDDRVEVNRTATLLCRASHSPEIDMIYQWKFNDHVIDYYIEPEFRQGEGSFAGTLYLVGAQFRHEGTYTCTAMTSMDSFSASAYLTVLGPPGEPAGVNVRTAAADITDAFKTEGNTDIDEDTTRWVVWTDGDSHGSDITHYFVEFRSEFDQNWRVHPDGDNIPRYSTMSDQYQDQHVVMLTDLKAFAGVEFRVLARNAFGIGSPSMPTEITQIKGTAVSQTVKNVRGGGGSVGDLTIVWDPLPREDFNGPDLQYYVGYREYDPNAVNAQWRWTEKNQLLHEAVCSNTAEYDPSQVGFCQYVVYVGAEYFYLPYEVQIYASNVYGDGPVTDPTRIMSAESLPLGVPEQVIGHQYNSTALRITWKPVPNTRDAVHGKLKGYKIMYWRRDLDEEAEALQNILELKPGQDNMDEGLIIGLQPRYWYKFRVMIYNSAGNGDKSSPYEQQVFNKAPTNYPTEVHVFSVEGFGVRVNFRGISTQALEEPLRGYKVQYWKANENILGADEADFGKMTTGVIRNLSSSEVYQLRVYGYSRAGQGNRSSPAIYFTVGDGQIVINPETTEIMSHSSVMAASLLLSLFAAAFVLLWEKL